MKQVAILFFAMQFACGSSDDSSDPPPPDVTRVNTTSGYCVSGSCAVSVSAVYSTGGTIAPSGYSVVIAKAEGVDPPAACDASSKNAGSTYATFEGLKPSTIYAFRACLFSNTAGTYSAGTHVVYTTPAS